MEQNKENNEQELQQHINLLKQLALQGNREAMKVLNKYSSVLSLSNDAYLIALMYQAGFKDVLYEDEWIEYFMAGGFDEKAVQIMQDQNRQTDTWEMRFAIACGYFEDKQYEKGLYHYVRSGPEIYNDDKSDEFLNMVLENHINIKDDKSIKFLRKYCKNDLSAIIAFHDLNEILFCWELLKFDDKNLLDAIKNSNEYEDDCNSKLASLYDKVFDSIHNDHIIYAVEVYRSCSMPDKAQQLIMRGIKEGSIDDVYFMENVLTDEDLEICIDGIETILKQNVTKCQINKLCSTLWERFIEDDESTNTNESKRRLELAIIGSWIRFGEHIQEAKDYLERNGDEITVGHPWWAPITAESNPQDAETIHQLARAFWEQGDAPNTLKWIKAEKQFGKTLLDGLKTVSDFSKILRMITTNGVTKDLTDDITQSVIDVFLHLPETSTKLSIGKNIIKQLPNTSIPILEYVYTTGYQVNSINTADEMGEVINKSSKLKDAKAIAWVQQQLISAYNKMPSDAEKLKVFQRYHKWLGLQDDSMIQRLIDVADFETLYDLSREKKSFDLLQIAAEGGCAKAQHDLGQQYLEQYNSASGWEKIMAFFKPSTSKKRIGEEWLKKAAKQEKRKTHKKVKK